MQLRSSAILILGLTLGAGAAFGHHYDSNNSITLTGTVNKIRWHKPYVKIHLEVADTNGKTKDWEVETATPSVLESRGLGSRSIETGDEITVYAYPASNGSAHALARSMTLSNGRTLSLGSQRRKEVAVRSESSSTPQSEYSSSLPRTATNLPLIALMGLIALGAATVLSARSDRLCRRS